MNKSRQEQKIQKALLLLDSGREEEAVHLLKRFLQDASLDEAGELLSAVRSAAILGDYYYQISDKKEAHYWMSYVIALSTKNEELEDVAGYEISSAKSVLEELKQEGI